jgi:hypothetical protein
MSADRRPDERPGCLLSRWLLNVLLAVAALATLLLGLTAPGPAWAKLTVGAAIVVALLGVLFWWGGYLHGRGGPPSER